METQTISDRVWFNIIIFMCIFLGYSLGKPTQDKIIIPTQTTTTILYSMEEISVLLEPGITIIGER